MRILRTVLPIVIVGAAVFAQDAAPTQTEPRTDTPDQTERAARASYAAGQALGNRTRSGLHSDGMGVDPDLVAKGFADALVGHEPMFSKRSMAEIRTPVHHEMESRRVRRLLADSPGFRELHDENVERGRRFRELFAQQPGVVVLPSGAMYLEITPGRTAAPGPTDTVVIRMRAQLLNRDVINDGTRTVELRVDETIAGGTEILQLMTIGATWQVVLPPELAFGEGGRYPDIGPNETITLRVELLEIRRASEGGSR